MNIEKRKIRRRAAQKRYVAAHKDKVRAQVKRWVSRNRAKVNEAGRQWRAKNLEKHKEMVRDWVRRNRPVERARIRERQAARLKATPKWTNKFFVLEAYRLAELRSKMTGFDWHVDHIVPLKSKIVCGLHAHTNIQVIPAKQNMSKGNYFWPNMP